MKKLLLLVCTDYHKKTLQGMLLIISMIFSTGVLSQNLLQNGGFECGGKGTGFNINSSFYTDVTASLPKATSSVGDYAVTTDPYNLNSGLFIHDTAHNGAGKNMLVCDGITTGGQQIFWQAGSSGGGICGLTVGATYYFSYWVHSVSNTCIDAATCANLAIKFNNTGTQWPSPTTGSQQVGLPSAGWQQVVYTFVPTNACVNIEMTNNNTNGVGNDFALDDMAVYAAIQPTLNLSETHTSPTCYIKGSDATAGGTDGTIFGYVSGGSSPYSFTLSSTNLTPAFNSTNNTGAFTNLLSGTYNLSVTDGVAATKSILGIKLGNLEDTLKVSKDTTICTGGTVPLTVVGGYNSPNSYVWTPSGSLTGPNTANPVATPASTTTYTVQTDTTISITTTQSLITNGDFESGNSSFYSDYTFNNNNSTLAQKVYGVLANPHLFETGFTACTDHTTGTGKMLVADGSIFNCSATVTDIVWAQTVKVVPGTQYTLSYWVETVSGAGNPAQISAQINGATVGSTTTPSTSTCVWKQFTTTWTAGAGITSAQIALYDLNPLLAGNDFAIDDISFKGTSTVTKTCHLTDSVKVTVITPASPSITCGAATTSSVTFNWSALTGATGYDISYQINGNPVVTIGPIGNLLTYQVSPLSAGDNVKITVTPTGASCFTAGTQTCTAITCTPPTVTVPADFAVCNNAAVATTNFTSTPAGATYTWTNSNTAIGLAVSGNGNVPAFTATNTGSTPITATITVTPTLTCSGTAKSYIITVNPTPAAPTVTVTNNCNGTSDLTASGYTGTLLWSNAATTATINVNNAAIYTVTQTINGCTSATGSGTSAPKTTPIAPTVTVTNNCNGTSDLTASGYTGTLLWSNAATTATINVNNAATYTVTQTVNGCTSATGSGTSAPKTTPIAPTVMVTNNCNGTSDLTASSYTGTLLWSNAATTATINVNNAATYTVTQTINGCTSTPGSGTSAPNTTPVAPTASVTQQPTCTVGGVITITAPTGANLEYSIDGATYQSGTSFAGLAAATYIVTVRNSISHCTSTGTSLTVNTPPGAPVAPTVTVINNCNGTSDLTASSYTGTLLWSNGSTTATINVNNAATYTVTQTVAGCTSPAGSGTSAPKTTPAAPTVTVTNNCNGTSDLTASGYTGTLLWSNGSSTATINVNNAATYTVTQTVAGCTSPAGSGTSAPKTTPAAPTVTVTNNCNGTSDLTASGYTGTLLWSNAATTATINVNNAATYTVTQTLAGCTSAAGSGTSAPKTTPTAPTVTVTNNCNGTSDLTASGYTGTLLWSNAATTSTINVNNAATYTVTQTVNGCTSATGSGTSAPKTTPAAPIVTVTNNCNGTSDLTASGYTGTLLWSNAATTATINVNNAATYTVTQTINGCTSATGSGTSAPNITPATPTASVTIQPSCATLTGTIIISSPSGVNIRYSLDGTNYQASGTFTGLTPGSTFFVTAKNIISGCVSSSITLSVNNMPPLPATPNASVSAQPTCIIPTGTITITAPTGANIQYSIGGIFQSSGIFSGLTPRNSYSITAKNTATGCVSSSTTLIIDPIPSNPASPTASITVQPNCVTPKGTIVVTDPNGANIQYSIGGAFQSNGTFTGLNPGATYNIIAKDFSTGCSSNVVSFTLNNLPANPAAPVAVVLSQPDCNTPYGSISISSPSGSTIEYSDNGTTYQGSNIFTGLTPGTTYTLKAKDDLTGCISSSSSIMINALPAAPAVPTASVTVQPTCLLPNGTITVTAPSGANIEYNINGSAYQSGTTFTGLNPGSSYSITAHNITTGCVSGARNITVSSLPASPAAPTATVTTQPTCPVPSAVITITKPSSASIVYSIDGFNYQSGKIFTGLQPGSVISITAKDNTTSCVSAPALLNINPMPSNPIVNAGPDREILVGESIKLLGQASPDNATISWTPNFAILHANTLQPTVSPVSNQTYILTATSAEGCVASDEVKVIVLKNIDIPNTFSPNGDSKNDKWIITNIEYYPNARISIFNRYGQFLFESTGYNKPWDGTYNGSPVPVGTYFWIIRLKADSLPISGSVSVIR